VVTAVTAPALTRTATSVRSASRLYRLAAALIGYSLSSSVGLTGYWIGAGVVTAAADLPSQLPAS
jgi:hypothetical protein